MSAPRHLAALAALRVIVATAIGVAVVTEDTGFAQPTTDKGDRVRLMATLPPGRSDVIAELLGGERPFEVAHAAQLLIGVIGGTAAAKRTALATAAGAAAAAIGADRTIGGLVDDLSIEAGDWQEATENAGPHVVGVVLDLTLLIQSETELG